VALEDGANELIARGARNSHKMEDRCAVTYEDRRPERLAARSHFALAMTASPCAYLDSSSVAWEPGRAWQAGSWGTIGGRAVTSHHRIFGTPDDALFQTSAEGIEGLRFDVPDGDYELELRFAETGGRTPGERVFDVTANGAPIVTGLDLTASTGPFTAVIRTAQVNASGGAGVRVDFRASRGAPTMSAARLTRR
jgi:beta-galactosidase